MAVSQEDLDDLLVLERVMAAKNTPLLKGKRPSPDKFMGALEFTLDQTARYGAALKRLIERQILMIARVGNQWALSEVHGKAANERARLQAATSDPVARLRRIAVELRQLKARIGSGVEDTDPLTEQAATLADEAADLAERMAG